MISVDEALSRCLALVTPLPPEPVALRHAAGRWMASPAIAAGAPAPVAPSITVTNRKVATTSNISAAVRLYSPRYPAP